MPKLKINPAVLERRPDVKPGDPAYYHGDYDVETRPDNREHGAWDYSPFVAMWMPDFQRNHHVRGCPCGRGNTPEGALRNLIERTEVHEPAPLVPEDEIDMLVGQIIEGSAKQGAPLSPRELQLTGMVLLRLSYRLRHAERHQSKWMKHLLAMLGELRRELELNEEGGR